MPGSDSKEVQKQAYTLIIARVRDMIRKGEFQLGERLPPERKLAEMFGISRSTLRQAFQAMAERRIIESRHGDGTYLLANIDASFPEDVILDAIVEQNGFLESILEFRQLIEPQIAALAARRITPDGIDQLKILVCDQQRALLAGKNGDTFDAEFHRMLAEYASNKVISRIMTTVQSIMNDTRSSWLQSDDRHSISVEGHLRIIDALAVGDENAACAAMKDHIANIEQVILGEMEKN
jgi:GntR family transcriptional regulator, transcriptional repressor for pyruvate dehydrogenase complex